MQGGASIDFEFGCSILFGSARADVKLAQLAEQQGQIGQMVEHQSS